MFLKFNICEFSYLLVAFFLSSTFTINTPRTCDTLVTEGTHITYQQN